MHDGLTGVWMLRSFYLEDTETGERTEPFGPHPTGTLILNAGGRMAALITPSERTSPANEAEQAMAFQKLIAYSGRYRLESPDRFVTSVDVAWFQPWVGTDQSRTYTLDGDRLDIVSAPTRLPREQGRDATVVGVLSWVREGVAFNLEP